MRQSIKCALKHSRLTYRSTHQPPHCHANTHQHRLVSCSVSIDVESLKICASASTLLGKIKLRVLSTRPPGCESGLLPHMQTHRALEQPKCTGIKVLSLHFLIAFEFILDILHLNSCLWFPGYFKFHKENEHRKILDVHRKPRV